MELRKLTREVLVRRSKKGVAMVSFSRRGHVILSRRAMNKLNLQPGGCVDIFDGATGSEFFISKGTTYKTRRNAHSGGGVFSSIDLCWLVLDKSWQQIPHGATDACPDRINFVICDRPLDDDENRHIFALIRKKA